MPAALLLPGHNGQARLLLAWCAISRAGWRSRATCPLCGNPTRRAPGVIDEPVEAVIDEGGSINHVKADTKLKDCALAATLRFPLPPMTSPGA